MGAPRATRDSGFRTFTGICLLALTLSAVLALAGGSAKSAVAADAQGPLVVPGELIVGFEDDASKSAQSKALAQAGATKAEAFPQIDVAVVKVAAARAADATKLLLANPRVRYVEPNYRVRTMATPNDPSFGQLWGLHNTGQTGGTPDADIDAPEAWELETGSSSVVVGVTDTGVDFSHPDLAAQQWVNTGENCGSGDPGVVCAQRSDGVDNDTNGYVDDWRGWDFANNDNNPVDDHDHGTHVSGTIGAVGDNATGVAGVNWNVKIMALKFLDQTGFGDTAGAIGATLYAANNGAKVSSNSWGGGPFEQSLLDAIEYGASRGMLFVAAAGNDSSNNDTTVSYPSGYASEAIVSVAATDHADQLAFFSNYGVTSVDLGAPGVNVLSTVRNGGYQSFSGTSMATPHVSGVAALLKARFPGASPYALKAMLLSTVDAKPALATTTATGGRLNAHRAASCDDEVQLLLDAPSPDFAATVGDTLRIGVIATQCAAPMGLANVSVTVNGSPVTLAGASPDNGLYSASYFVSAAGPLAVTATLSVGGTTISQTAAGEAFLNYVCEDVSMSWVDVTPGTRLNSAGGDDSFSTLNIGFPVTYFGQTYTTAYVSSNGFLALGSNAGAADFSNDPVPSTEAPNGVVAPLWDDLNPSAGGAVYAGVTGTAPNRTLHIEWHQVPHFSFGPSGTVTFELSLKENGNVRFQYLDTDFSDSRWNAGASATAGLENAGGVIGREVSFNQPLLTSGRAVSCAYGAPPPPPPVPTITTTTLAGGQVGTAYSQSLAATGGTPGYTWTLDAGSLPAGLSLSSGGAITGTPTSAGPSTFTVRVTDSLSQTDTQELTIAVAPPPVPTVATASLPGGQVGTSYSQSLAATGGTPPYGWTLDVGSLPAGLALSSGGAITGTPTSAGPSTFTVRVTDSLSQTATKELTIAVAPPPVPTVATTSLPGGQVGTAYSQSLAATGGTPPYGWTLDAGSLPAGLSLSSGGAITGTPTSAGPSTFTVRVTDSLSQTATKELTIAVAPPPVPTISTTSLPGGTVGQPYSQSLTATGGTPGYSWTLDAGSLPAGLALSAGGAITGTPNTAGSATFTVRVTDSLSQTDTQELTIAVLDVLTITTTTLPSTTVTLPYSQTVQAAGGTPPYSWSVVAGALPPGLGLNGVTGVVSGTSTMAGTFSFTLQVADGTQTDSQGFTILVNGLTSVSATPSDVAIETGTLRAGNAARLASDNNSYYQVNSTTAGTRTTSWYGRFTGVTNALSNLRVTYKGKNSRACTQTVAIWRFSDSTWVQLDSRSVGTSEVNIANLAPGGTLATYVSGTNGGGELRVRVRCTRASPSFYSSGDYMRITYQRP